MAVQNNVAEQSIGGFSPGIRIPFSYFTSLHFDYRNLALEAKSAPRRSFPQKKIHNTTQIKEMASEYGGVIYSHYSTLNISHSLFYNNRVNGSGGTLFVELSAAIVNNCTFCNNSNTAVILTESTVATIINCTFQDNSCPFFAGALSVNISCELNIVDSTFLNNSAAFGGAISVVMYSKLMITKCSFSENSAILETWDVYKNNSGIGGALVIGSSKVHIFQSQFYQNYAYVSAGSVYAEESLLLIHDTVFENNIADYNGGAVTIIAHCNSIIQESLFINNSAENKAVGRGGGLLIGLFTTVNIAFVNFFKNEAPEGGAIFGADFSEITLHNTTLEGNKGSAIYIVIKTSLQISDSRIYNNTEAYKGGAVFIETQCLLFVLNTMFEYNEATTSGGALYVDAISAVSLYNCSFTSNSAFKGGALAVYSSDIKIFATNFTKNKAANGGVCAVGANLHIELCMMDNNTVTGNGGVAYMEINTQLNITTSIFNGNSALGSGGVFWIRSSTLNVRNSSFSNNSVGVNGGVIDADDMSLINMSHTICIRNKVTGGKGGLLDARTNTKIFLHDVKILENFAPSCGAVILDIASTLEITECAAQKNTALALAGAFYIVDNSSLIAINSSFKENSAFHAGSIVIDAATGYLENCTFRGNQGTNAGAITYASNELRISNTVFWDNKAQKVADISYEANETLTMYRSQFIHGKETLYSNRSNFKQIAMKDRYIGNSGFFPSILEIRETQYAASKNFQDFLTFLVNYSNCQ